MTEKAETGESLTDSGRSLQKRGIFSIAVIVSALGYFVDVYDIVLFGIVRTPSLRAIGIPEEEFFSKGVLLLNTQMAGMIIGGILWGMLGDKRGRLSVLFGSILLYSLANLANAFVTNIDQYLILRFLAGVGLAGELGGAVMLVSEILPKEKRGYGATVISCVGLAGGVFAGVVSQFFDWRMCYIIGGVMGLVLLALRFKVMESGMYEGLKHRADVSRGNFFLLLWPPRRLLTYVACIVVAMPIYYSILVFAYFAPELTKELGATGPVMANTALMYFYIGITAGGLLSGILSEKFRNRKIVFGSFLALSVAGALVYLLVPPGLPPAYFYAAAAFNGLGAGYWTLFMVISAEQFGTNIRATASSTITNFVRAATIAVTSSYGALKIHISLQDSALIVGAVCFALAFPALLALKETYGKDLDYLEEK